MKKNNIITFAIIAAAVLYIAGGVADIRRQSVPVTEAPAAVTAQVTETAPAEEVKPEIKAQEVTLSFQSNPTTGYSWVAKADNDVFDIEDSFTASSEDGLLGAGGTQTYRLIPKHTGTAKIDFVYERPFDHTCAASRTYLFEVDPEMHVRFVGVAGHNGAADAGVPFEVPEITALS